jgi:probable phosphoglycerate mutase
VTTFILVRHGSNDLLGKALAGRAPGVHLNEAGRREAEQLAEYLAAVELAAIYASPRERARETAAPAARRHGLEVHVNAALDEIDFGDWTGRSFSDLRNDPEWPVWVDRRSTARVPNGEAIEGVQRRIVTEMERLRSQHPSDTVALFTHGDVIKAALAHFMRVSLDDLERFDIAPASVSIIAAGVDWAQVKLVNGADAVQRS